MAFLYRTPPHYFTQEIKKGARSHNNRDGRNGAARRSKIAPLAGNLRRVLDFFKYSKKKNSGLACFLTAFADIRATDFGKPLPRNSKTHNLQTFQRLALMSLTVKKKTHFQHKNYMVEFRDPVKKIAEKIDRN